MPCPTAVAVDGFLANLHCSDRRLIYYYWEGLGVSTPPGLAHVGREPGLNQRSWHTF